MDSISVLLVDDHQVVRQGLRDFLELQDDLDVVGEASSGEEGVKLARDLLPDVVLMDLVMPTGIDGVEATRRVKDVSPTTRIIVLTSFADDNKVFPAIKAGAISYLLKDISPEELAHAIRAVRAWLDGEPLRRAWFRHHEIAGGATLRLEMGFLLSGQDFHPEENPRNPYEAGISFVVDLETGRERALTTSGGEISAEQARALRFLVASAVPGLVPENVAVIDGLDGLDAVPVGDGWRTVHAEEEYLVPVVEAGASGYLTKTSADRDLVEAINVVAKGEVYLPPQATKLLLREYKAAEEGGDQSRLHELSSREQEVLALTAEGFSSREIGEKLFISPKTVDTYRSRIMKKLELNHRSELVRFALKVGLLKEV